MIPLNDRNIIQRLLIITFIAIQTDPDEATAEINGLDVIVTYAHSSYPEQDFIIMGDLNADSSYYDGGGTSTLSGSQYYWVIDDSINTTTKSTDYTYDLIIITDSIVSDLSGDSGVFRYDVEYGLTVDETVAVSDHYPVFMDIWGGMDTDRMMNWEINSNNIYNCMSYIIKYLHL